MPWVESVGQNRGGRAYLEAELKKLGYSRRRAVAIINKVFEEMGLALRRGEYVEFPFGYLKAEKRLSRRWQAFDDEPMRPWFIDHITDGDGERLLEGEPLPAWPPGWSRKGDNRSWMFWDQARLPKVKKDAPSPPSPARTARRRSGK